jgi:hypothetical protein
LRPLGGTLEQEILPAAVTVGVLLAATAVGLLAHDDGDGGRQHFEFKDDTLVLSRSAYMGKASTVTIGETLPGKQQSAMSLSHFVQIVIPSSG